MSTTRTCPQCQQPLPIDAPEGLCPACVMQNLAASAADSPTEIPSGASQPSEPLPDIGNADEVARRLPQFEIGELLGRGGMGVVYKAVQRQLDRIVALKILPPADALSPDFVERFRREARSLAKLSHPNIVNVHDFGESGGLYYFVMEFVDGVNLREMIRSGKMKAEEALAVVPKICDALQFAHEEGVVHRDIKPENILVDKRGRVKIADFGLAKLLRREQTDQTLTMSGMTLGTPRYMAPEQLDKPETVDHRADIYSLGVVFYEMLTGEVPMGRFAPPSEKVQIDVRLDEIVLHALERDANRRYQHASEVRDDVEKVTSKPQVAPDAAAKTPEPWAFLKGTKGRPARVGLAPLGAVLLILVLIPFINISSRALVLSALMVTLAVIVSVLCGAVLAIFGEWRTIQSPLKCKVLRTLLWLVVVFCVGSFFGSTGRISSSGAGVSFAIGTPFPWFESGVGKHFSMNVLLASWAWAYFAAGWLSLHALGKSYEVWPPIARSGKLPADEIKPGEEKVATKQKSQIPAWMIVFCAIGLVGCLWPYSIVDHSFLGMVEQRENASDSGVWLVGTVGLEGHSPATKAGVVIGDRILSMGGRPTHVAGLGSPDRIWSETPLGTDVEITLLRNNQKMTLHTVRSADPVTVCFYAVWQFVAGFTFLLCAVLVLLVQPLGPGTRWPSLVVTILGFGLVLLLFLGVSSFWQQPAKELWNVLRHSYDYSPPTLWQKLDSSIAAFALLLLGVLGIRSSFSLAKADRSKAGVKKSGDNPDAAAPVAASPVESEAARRARASWFGRRSARFRTLLPAVLLVLMFVCVLLAIPHTYRNLSNPMRTISDFGWPSPWLECILTAQKEGGFALSWAIHPLTASFLSLVTGLALPFLAHWFVRRDQLVRYGLRFRDVRKDIRRKAQWKIHGGGAVAALAPIVILVSMMVLKEGGWGRNGATANFEFRLLPHSKAYDRLLIGLPFYSNREQTVEHYRRPNRWDMALGLITKPGAEPVVMNIQMPSLKAGYMIPEWSKDFPKEIVLDLDELTEWMSDRGHLDITDEKVRKEAGELMALLKQFSRQPPANIEEYTAARESLMPDFDFFGWSNNVTFAKASNLDFTIGIYLACVAVFLALYAVVVSRIQHAALALDREVRERGESVLARVRFRDLPPPVRRRALRRGALAAVVVILLPLAGVMWWRHSQPKPARERFRYELTSASPNFHALTLTCFFASYLRGGETWLVDPVRLPLKMEFTLVDGTKRTCTVELPGLRAMLPVPNSPTVAPHAVTLDAEELASWMRDQFGPTADETQVTADAEALIAFLKNFATKPPSTPAVLLSKLRKLERFPLKSWEASLPIDSPLEPGP